MTIRQLFTAIMVFCFLSNALGQNELKLKILDEKSGEPLVGVAVVQLGTTKGGVSDLDGGLILRGPSTGDIKFVASFVGYKSDTLMVSFPLTDATKVFTIKLMSEATDLDEAIVTSTRTNARIEDQPTKVEVLGLEELNEENGIKPSNIGSLLGDLSVIHIQQTSAVSGGSAVRLQGLDGKYTQLLRDGLPLYEGFSGGLGILQIPPLDLKQVEIIKGSVSTLYGGGAISGLINLVSKTPTEKPEANITLNQSTLKESNINTYLSKKWGNFGVTFFGGTTYQKAVDVNSDGFSDVPDVKGLLLHPRLFWTNEKTKIDAGWSGTFEQRDGGDMQLLTGGNADATHQFFEKNATQRNTFDGHFSHNFTKTFSLAGKTAVSLLDRTTTSGGAFSAIFNGKFATSYSEISFLKNFAKNDLVGGINVVTQSFNKAETNGFDYKTYGIFLQNTWKPNPNWIVEGGFRLDNTNNFGNFYLPRVSALYKPSKDWSIRLGAGSGYRTPDIFSDGEGNLLVGNQAKAESSTGVNFDGNWHTLLFDKLSLTINQAFYLVNIKNSVVIERNILTATEYLTNSTGITQTLGTDTYVRLAYDEIELYLGYNHTLAQRFDGNDKFLNYIYYSPQDKFAMTLAYDLEGEWRFGVENAWVGNQYKSDGTKAKNYWFFAGMVERKFKRFSIVLNGENLADFRQSRFEPLYDGTTANPRFRALWSPIDGRVINLSLKINLL
jgi:outer membrane receptor for ferrienterochelin and colicins